jgi:hypothetical protein
MTSNAWTIPGTVRHAPGTCFKPRRPALPNLITALFTIQPDTTFAFGTVTVTLRVHDPNWSSFTVVRLTWNLPGITTPMPATIHDAEHFEIVAQKDATTGTFDGTVRTTYPNGNTKTFHYPYTTTPFTPP